jgi:hypothetical protein
MSGKRAKYWGAGLAGIDAVSVCLHAAAETTFQTLAGIFSSNQNLTDSGDGAEGRSRRYFTLNGPLLPIANFKSQT